MSTNGYAACRGYRTRTDLQVRRILPGLVIAGVGVALAIGLHRVVDALGVLTWSILLGAVATNVGVVPARATEGLRFVAKRLLRLGIVLLGFSLSIGAIAALGGPVSAMITTTLTCTLFATMWLGHHLGLGRPRSADCHRFRDLRSLRHCGHAGECGGG